MQGSQGKRYGKQQLSVIQKEEIILQYLIKYYFPTSTLDEGAVSAYDYLVLHKLSSASVSATFGLLG